MQRSEIGGSQYPYGLHRLPYPDITITRTDGTGLCVGLVVFDPKYREGASLLAGVRDLHVYRDAIRGMDDRPLTVAAAALSPRPFNYDETAIWAGVPAPGVITAHPGQPGDAFENLLQNAIAKLASLGEAQDP